MSNKILTSTDIQWLYEECKKFARQGKVTSYGNVAQHLGLDLSDVDDRVHKLGGALDDMNKMERKRDSNAPMISAVVIHKADTKYGGFKTRMPGTGFFKLAKDWGKQPKGMSDLDFFKKELTNVFKYWKNR